MKTTIHVKLNRYLYFHATHDHQTGHQALFSMATYGPYGNNFQFLTTIVATFIGDNLLGGNFLGVIFLGDSFQGGDFQRGEISEDGTFIGGYFHRGQFSGGNFSGGNFFGGGAIFTEPLWR